MIVKDGDKYTVKSKSGENLSKRLTKKEAVKRLKQIEFFKKKDKDVDKIKIMRGYSE